MVTHRTEVALNEAEIREFLATEYRRLVNALALVWGSTAAAEDAVQEALARAWERTERGHHIESPTAWVAAVATNLLRDRWRRLLAERRARHRLGKPYPGVDALAAVEGRADVSRALAELTRRQREVAVFRYFLDMDVAAIARALRLPEGTVKSALHRARRSLAAALGERDQDPEVADARRR